MNLKILTLDHDTQIFEVGVTDTVLNGMIDGYNFLKGDGSGLPIEDDFTFNIVLDQSIPVNGFVIRQIATANSIPEPATMLLFGIGLLGLAGVGRQK